MEAMGKNKKILNCHNSGCTQDSHNSWFYGTVFGVGQLNGVI